MLNDTALVPDSASEGQTSLTQMESQTKDGLLIGIIRQATHHERALIAVLQQQPGLLNRLIDLWLCGSVTVICGCFLTLPGCLPGELGHRFPERRSRTDGAHQIWVPQACGQVSFQRLPMLIAPHLVAVADLPAHRHPHDSPDIV